jgi:hypothetical protein
MTVDTGVATIAAVIEGTVLVGPEMAPLSGSIL